MTTTTTTIVPNKLDVLCGKSRDCLQAEGSRRFRDIIDTHVAAYTRCKTKFEKMRMTSAIYDQVSQESRFLKLDATRNEWVELTTMAARDKVSHALRFASRAKRRHLSGLNKRKKFLACHERSGSISSSSSCEPIESSPFGWASFVNRIQVTDSSSFEGPEIPEPVSSDDSFSSSSTLTNNSLDNFLDLEQCFSNGNDAEKTFDSYPVGDYVMTDMHKVGNTLEADGDEESLLSLLSEPMGDWELEGSAHLF